MDKSEIQNITVKLGEGWKCVVSFKFRRFFSAWNETLYPMKRQLCGSKIPGSATGLHSLDKTKTTVTCCEQNHVSWNFQHVTL